MDGFQIQTPVRRKHANKSKVKEIKTGDTPVIVFMKNHSNKSGIELAINVRKITLSHVKKIILRNALEIKKVDPIFTLRIFEEIILEKQMEPTESSSRQPEQATQAEDTLNPEVMPSIEEMLQQAERKAQEHYDAWMYAKAEGENIRRRAQEDVSKARKLAVEHFSNEMLMVKDSLEAGLAVETATVESFKSGMELTLKQLAAVFTKFNINEINPLGEKFDAHKHQAISMVDSEQDANTVVSVMQKGYLLHDRVLRPALVMVAKGKE
jgi:molecular chaperone GrpE